MASIEVEIRNDGSTKKIAAKDFDNAEDISKVLGPMINAAANAQEEVTAHNRQDREMFEKFVKKVHSNKEDGEAGDQTDVSDGETIDSEKMESGEIDAEKEVNIDARTIESGDEELIFDTEKEVIIDADTDGSSNNKLEDKEIGILINWTNHEDHTRHFSVWNPSRKQAESVIKFYVEMASEEAEKITVFIEAEDVRIGGTVKLEKAEARIEKWFDCLGIA